MNKHPNLLYILSLLILAGFFLGTPGPNVRGFYPDKSSKKMSPDNQSAANANVQQKVDQPEICDPNCDPNEAMAEVEAFFKTNHDQPLPAQTTTTSKFWQRRYHPQVSPGIFSLLSYPYYRGGQEYPASILPASNNTNDKITPPNQNINDPNILVSPGGPPPALLNELRKALERGCDLIHQWRSINEAPSTALEVVYAIELTKTSSGIYQTKPHLAVNVKRTIGQIGRKNRQFDAISRMIIQTLLTGYIDKTLLARMEKQITDLESLLERLAEQNDAISIELGIGKINRQTANPKAGEPIKFSRRKKP